MIDFSKMLDSVKSCLANMNSFHLCLLGLGGFATFAEINKYKMSDRQIVDTDTTIEANNRFIESDGGEK